MADEKPIEEKHREAPDGDGDVEHALGVADAQVQDPAFSMNSTTPTGSSSDEVGSADDSLPSQDSASSGKDPDKSIPIGSDTPPSVSFPFGVMIAVIADGYPIRYLSERFMEIIGLERRYDIERCYNGKAVNMIPFSERPYLSSLLKKARKTHSPVSFESCITRIDGIVIAIKGLMFCCRSLDGIEIFQALILDCSEGYGKDYRRQSLERAYAEMDAYDEVYEIDYGKMTAQAIKRHATDFSEGIQIPLEYLVRKLVDNYVVPDEAEYVRNFFELENILSLQREGMLPYLKFHYRMFDGKEVWCSGVMLPIEQDLYLFCNKIFQNGEDDDAEAVLQKEMRDQVGQDESSATRRFVVLEWDALSKRFYHFGSFNDCKASLLTYADFRGEFMEQAGIYIDDRAALRKLIDGISVDEPYANIMVRVQLLDETFRWVRADIQCIYDDDDGTPLKQLIVLTDMDEEVRMQQQAEDLLGGENLIVETLSAGLSVYRMDGPVPVLIYISETAREIFGITEEEGNRRIREQVPGFILLSEGDVDAERFRSLKQNKSLRFRKFIRKDNGSFVCYQIFMMLSYEPAIGQECCRTIIYDITESMEREHRERWHEERYRLLSETPGVSTFDYDPDEDVMTWIIYDEDAGVQEHSIGHFMEYLPNSAIVHPDSIQPYIKALREASSRAMSGELEYQVDFFGTGYRWWWARFKSIEDEYGHVYRVVGRIDDIQKAKMQAISFESMVDKEVALRRSITYGAIYVKEFDLVTGERLSLGKGEETLDLADPIVVDNLADALVALFGSMHPDDRRSLIRYRDVDEVRKLSRQEHRKLSFDCRMTSNLELFSGYHWMQVTYAFVAGTDVQHPSVLIYIIDIDEDKRKELALIQQTHEDTLTALVNRAEFAKSVSSYLDARRSDETTDPEDGGMDMLALITVDNLQVINETYGIVSGDKALKKTADALRLLAHGSDVCGRISGNEFAIFVTGIYSTEMLNEQARVLFVSLQRKLDESISLAISMGIAVYPDDATSYEALYGKADSALRVAYNNSGDTEKMVFHVSDMDEKVSFEETNIEDYSDEHIYIRTFGYFDVFVDGQAVPFRSSKVKELLALLVSRRGGFISANEAIGYLWEEEPANKTTLARYRKVAMRLNNFLQEHDIEEIVENSNGVRRAVPGTFRCDSYDFLSGDPTYSSLFKGAYMSNYSWGETLLPQLRQMKGD